MPMRGAGLPGKYTQILRDGMPCFGGYSGSFSILQIPPADLKQIEIVKCQLHPAMAAASRHDQPGIQISQNQCANTASPLTKAV